MKIHIYKAVTFLLLLCCIHRANAQDIILQGGTLTASYDNGAGQNSGEGSSKVIDNNIITKFLVNPFRNPATEPLWLKFECTNPAVAAQYVLTSGGDAQTRDPKNWKLEGSNDNTNWTLLDTRTDQIFPSRTQSRIFDIANPGSYKYYMLTIQANSGSSLFQMAEWRLWEGVAPAAPASLEGTAISGASIQLSWLRNSINEAGFDVERSKDGVTYTKISTVAAMQTTFVDNNLQPGTTCYYRVAAVNKFGKSAYSNVLTIQTLALSSELFNVNMDGGTLSVLMENSGGPTAGEGSLKVIDNNPATKYLPLNAGAFPATGLWIQYKAALSWIVTGYTLITANDDVSRDPKSWRFEGSNDGASWTILDTRTNMSIPLRSTPYRYSFANTTAFQYYRLYVTVNNGNTSTNANFQLGDLQIWGLNPTAPLLPTELSITGRTITAISLSWKNNGSSATGVDIQRSEDGILFGTVQSVAAGVSSYTDQNLFGGTQYWYRIRAKGNPANSVWTDTVSIFTDWDPRLPLTPRDLKASAQTETSVLVSWSDRSANETGFDIERSNNGTSFTKIGTAPLNATSYLDQNSGLTVATKYWYRIRAINAEGTSFYTNIADTITKGQNTAPVFEAIANKTTCSASIEYTIEIPGITSGGETWQTTSMAVSSNNAGLFSALSVSSVENGKATLTFRGAGARTQGGTATVTVTARDNGGTFNGGKDSYSRTFQVVITPLRVSITANPGTQITRFQTAQLVATGAPSYVWDDSAGIISPLNAASITVKPTLNTMYKVTGSNAEGCKADTSISIQIAPGVLAEAVNILTPNGDGKNDRWVIWNINRYPENTVSVFDRSGRVVFRQKNYTNTWDGSFNGKPLQEGSYYYVIELGAGIEPVKGMLTIIRDRK